MELKVDLTFDDIARMIRDKEETGYAYELLVTALALLLDECEEFPDFQMEVYQAYQYVTGSGLVFK